MPLPGPTATRDAVPETTKGDVMSEQNKQVVREYYERVLNGRDLDAVGEFFVDERMVEGVKGGCFRYFEAFPDLHVALDDLIAEGDRVFVRSTMTGTHDGEYKGIPATGRHVAAESAEVFRVADGKFVGYWCLANVAGLMRQLTEEVAASTA
jgi:predicted ester cyclase